VIAKGENERRIRFERYHQRGEELAMPEIIVAENGDVLAPRMMTGRKKIAGDTEIARIAIVA